MFRKLRAFRLEGLLANLLSDVLTAFSRNHLSLGLLMFSADLGSDLLAVLGRLAAVGAHCPLQGLALGGQHVRTDGVQHLLLHHHRDREANSPGHVLALRHGHLLAHHLRHIHTALLS